MKKLFKNEPNLPRAELFRDFVRLKIDSLRQFETLVEQGLIEERVRIETYKRDLKIEQFESEFEFDSYLDALNDDLFQTKEIEDTSKFLMVVQLKIVLETTTKRVLLWAVNSVSEEERNKFLKDMSYQKRLREKMERLNINIEDIADSLTIDELRCLCNAIKHGGLVDEELSKFAVWSNDIGKEINTTKIDLERYYEAIPKYIFDFTEKVKDSLISIQYVELSKLKQK